MTDAARSLWTEPRAPNPPGPGWPDVAMMAVLAPWAVLEGVFGQDRIWPGVSVVVVLALLPTLLWRRTHPLVVVVVAFGALAAVDVASILAGVDWEGVSAAVFVLVLVYALFRWGSGREAVTGLAIAMVPVLLGVNNPNPVADVLGGAMILLFPAVLGASVRYQDNARRRATEQVKLTEREQLARELHDTVAHHVSAIAIQAQAGRAIAASRPDDAAGAALDALAVIEEEASRTLAEMRAMVGALRQGDEAELGPQRGVADIERLAGSGGSTAATTTPAAADATRAADTTGPSGPSEATGTGAAPAGTDDGRPRVEVDLSGDLDGLWPAVDAALYRVAQESITNALRHARHATRIRVLVAGEGDCVRLVVSDDGDAVPATAGSSPGYGLVGMAERTHLLGGTFEAGPHRDGGWTVEAVLPRTPHNAGSARHAGTPGLGDARHAGNGELP
jgi:signal transduction histidine kinase